jgi:hypothetical protein
MNKRALEIAQDMQLKALKGFGFRNRAQGESVAQGEG